MQLTSLLPVSPRPGLGGQGGLFPASGLFRVGGVFSLAGSSVAGGVFEPEEFVVPESQGPVEYYAVAPPGHVYTAEQDAQYATRKMTSLSQANAQLGNAAPTITRCINIIGDWTGLTDQSRTNFSGPIGTGEFPIVVRTIGLARHKGVWDTAQTYHRVRSTASANGVVNFSSSLSHLIVDGLMVEQQSPSTSDFVDIARPIARFYGDSLPGSPPGRFIIRNNLFKGRNDTSYSDYGVDFYVNGNNNALYFYNNIIFDNARRGGVQGLKVGAANNSLIFVSYNTVIPSNGSFGHGVSTGSVPTSTTLELRNNYISGPEDSIVSSVWDIIAGVAVDDEDPLANFTNVPKDNTTFLDPTNGDFRLIAGTVLNSGNGVDMSGLGHPVDYSYNIAGQLRSPGNIGAF